ncbi:DUF1380 family protein [Escherichia coli]|nr:DUF1380 family protein [Escherichia coli]
MAPIACLWRRIPKFWNWIPASKIEKETRMYGTCETLCRELAAKYPGDAPLMLVIWSPEEIQALADGMEISLTDHEIRTVLARMEDIPEDQRTESGISSAAVMEIISNVSENRQVFARQGEVMNPLQYVPFNQTLYFINGDDPAQVAWMKRQTPPTLESKIILVQGSIPEMQKALDSRIYFDQNGVLCQRLGIDQVPARVSAVPGDRFLKVEFIPAEEGRK